MQGLGYLTLALLVAGCGSDSSQTGGSGPGTPVPAAASVSEAPVGLAAPRATDDFLRLEDDSVLSARALSQSQPVTVSLLDNDTLNNATVTAFDSKGSAGGQVSITPDGILTYL